MEFSSDSLLYIVDVEARILDEMTQACVEAVPLETGGILIGYYSSDLRKAVVTNVSKSPADSVLKTSCFERGTLGLQSWINSFWNSRQRRYYLGEWHFHPYSDPEASPQDVWQLHAIALSVEYHCPEPILMIVGGDPHGDWRVNCYISVHGKELLLLH